MSDTRFSSKHRASRAEAATFLRDLADRLESGNVTLGQGPEAMTLAVAGALTVAVKASGERKRGGQRTELEIELAWDDGAGVEGWLRP